MEAVIDSSATTAARAPVRGDHRRPQRRRGSRAGDAARGVAERAQAPRPGRSRPLARLDRTERLPPLGAPTGRDAGLLARLEAARPWPGPSTSRSTSSVPSWPSCSTARLSLLPADTRDVLVHRYVHDSPHAEIGERFGLSEDAVSMRLSRGKVVLRRAARLELRDEAAAYGLLVEPDDDWRPTRIWCADCGKQRLVARREPAPGALSFRCPGCSCRGAGRVFPLSNPVFADRLGGVVRPDGDPRARARVGARLFLGRRRRGPRACTRCGRPVLIARYTRARSDEAPAWPRRVLRCVRRAGVVFRGRAGARSAGGAPFPQGAPAHAAARRLATSRCTACPRSSCGTKTPSAQRASTSCSRARRSACSTCTTPPDDARSSCAVATSRCSGPAASSRSPGTGCCTQRFRTSSTRAPGRPSRRRE